MLLLSLVLIPVIGIFAIVVKGKEASSMNVRYIALIPSMLNLFLSLLIFILFDFSTNQFQFVQEYHEISYFDFYLGIDGLSIYFVLLTTIIIPISLLSNWTSISNDVESYVIIILLLETLLLAVFLVLDILLFYIFFESILPPLFILIGIFGSDNRVKASFYFFLYTLFGSLFLLLSILGMSSVMSTTDFDALFKGNFLYLTQLFLFYGIFIAFAVKTPTIFLNSWLLKAHVESPLGGSIILAAIVLKLSIYGILRLILPVLPKAYMEYTYIIYLIGVITIIYASLSTLRTIDVKELIAYSSVSHAAVYLLAMFSNSIQGIEGGINLGLAHGLVSPGLFICAGGVLYDRSHTRLISFYKGMAQLLPLFAVLFFILCLANCGAPLTLNFVGEFMSLYGVFERSSLYGVFASSSIVFSAAYTIYMYQRISFGGSYSRMFTVNFLDLNKREFVILFVLIVPTILFGIYTAPILDGINYAVSTLIYSFDSNTLTFSLPVVLGWAFDNPPKPHAFTSLPLQSALSLTCSSSACHQWLQTWQAKMSDVCDRCNKTLTNMKTNPYYFCEECGGTICKGCKRTDFSDPGRNTNIGKHTEHFLFIASSCFFRSILSIVRFSLPFMIYLSLFLECFSIDLLWLLLFLGFDFIIPDLISLDTPLITLLSSIYVLIHHYYVYYRDTKKCMNLAIKLYKFLLIIKESVKGKALSGYLLAVQLFSDHLRILKDRTAPGLEWTLHNPPKPHAFTSLPLQSGPCGDCCDRCNSRLGLGASFCDWCGLCFKNHFLYDVYKEKPEYKQLVDPTVNKPALPPSDPCDVAECQDEIRKGLTTKSESNYLPLILGVFIEIPLIDTIFSLSLLFDIAYAEWILTIQSLLLVYRAYKLPSRVMNIYSLLVKIYNFIINSKITRNCVVMILVLIISWVFSSFNIISCDVPMAWALYFQYSASLPMEALVELYNNIMYYLVAILFNSK